MSKPDIQTEIAAKLANAIYALIAAKCGERTYAGVFVNPFEVSSAQRDLRDALKEAVATIIDEARKPVAPVRPEPTELPPSPPPTPIKDF